MVKISSLFSFEGRLRLFQIYAHLVMMSTFFYGSWWWFLAGYVVWMVIGCVGISVGYHRLLSHKSFKAPGWFRSMVMLLGCLATGGTPMGWVGVHREHHRNPDKKGDPHSPWEIGFWRTYIHDWGHVRIRRRFIADLLNDPLAKLCQRWYFSILIGYNALCFLLFGFPGVAIGYAIPAVYAFHAYGLINSLGHMRGYRSYNTMDESRNNWLVNVLTFGEGWHNNHHHRPGSWKIGEKWWELDPGAWVIRMVKQ